MSRRYQVTIQGTGFSVPTDDGWGIVGFFAIRRVLADDANEAYRVAVAKLKQENKFQWLVENSAEEVAGRLNFCLESIGKLSWWRWTFTRAPKNFAFYGNAEDEMEDQT